MGSNGLAGFVNNGMTAYSNTDIPTTDAPHAALYPYWDDLDPTAAGSIRYGTEGTAPNRRFVISWVGVPHFNTTSCLSFQIVLYEGSGEILFQYLDVKPGDTDFGMGQSATIGIEQQQGLRCVKFSFQGTMLLSNNQALLFTPGMSSRSVKNQADGQQVILRQQPMTYASGDIFYIEDTTRTTGIKVLCPGHGLTPGMKADVYGTVQTDEDFERYIAASCTVSGGQGSIAPFFVSNGNIGGGDCGYEPSSGKGQRGITGSCGLNNIGLLVKVYGNVTGGTGSETLIDDGCGKDIKVLLPPGVPFPGSGARVVVTGAVSCLKEEQSGKEVLRPLIRARSIQIL